jgi:dTDP-L-rhamnose 4-epimerase
VTGKQILITGGAGFIGSYLAPELVSRGHRVIIVDNLLAQVHGEQAQFTDSLKNLAVCAHGDVRDPMIWSRLASTFPDVEIIIHLAAMTGTGQSMYEIREYEDVNSGGAAALLQSALDRIHPEQTFGSLRHVILASSRAVYGEGAYRCDCSGNLQFPAARTAAQLADQKWGFGCRHCGKELSPAPTPEAAAPSPASFYGATKLAQEYYFRSLLRPAGLGLSIFRLQNVFGPGQSLSNPYTGVLGVFCSNILTGSQIEIFEDGEISRDFVYVSDVVDAIAGAVDTEPNGLFNIGSGEFTRLADVARWLCGMLDQDVPIVARGTYRVGDVRHQAADIRAAHAKLGFQPRVSVTQGLQRYAEWVRYESPMDAAKLSESFRDLRSLRQAA